MAIINRLPVEGYEKAVAGTLHSLSEGTDAETFFTFVRAQRARGHLGLPDLEDLGFPAARLAKRPGGLPEDILELIEEALRDRRPDAEEQQAPERLDESGEHASSILWDSSKLGLVSGGIYPLLQAIWWGRLLRDPCEAGILRGRRKPPRLRRWRP